jgi:hypothetical protein
MRRKLRKSLFIKSDSNRFERSFLHRSSSLSSDFRIISCRRSIIYFLNSLRH